MKKSTFFIHLGNTGLTIWFILYIKNIKPPLKRDGSDITRTLVFTHDQKITYFQVWEMVLRMTEVGAIPTRTRIVDLLEL